MATDSNHIVMIASENGALAGGKVGGVGDVIAGLPKALAALGVRVTIITPSYGYLHNGNESTHLTTVRFSFGGQYQEGELWEVKVARQSSRIRTLVFEHPALRGEPIYFNDPPESPFMRDATKYALFCAAIGQYLKNISPPFLLHLHDWHAATLLLLREFHPDFLHLKNIKSVFTIHNLSIQGTRPMRGHESSVEAWFPELFNDNVWVAQWKDHRYEVPCYTPIAIGIRLADKVNTVSPTYAEEILQESNPDNLFYGGEGLNEFLLQAKQERRLFGILNGCEYPIRREGKLSFVELCTLIEHELRATSTASNGQELEEELRRIIKHRKSPPKFMLTSVTRVVDQKARLFFERGSDYETSFQRLLEILNERKGVYFFLGAGTPEYEARLLDLCKDEERFVFLRRCSAKIANALYANGTLFVMPSIYEPCGISQLQAMREGQPCLVHLVGGLKDTVQHGVNGFGFSGNSTREKVDNFVHSAEETIRMYLKDGTAWGKIQQEARRARFTWRKSAEQYIELLYR